MDIADVPEGLETTGRYIVTFKDGARDEGLALLNQQAGIAPNNMMSSLDFGQDGIDMAQVPADGGVMLNNIGIAILNAPPESAGVLAMEASENSSILAVEPEGIMRLIDQGFSVEYLRGFNDASATLLERAQRENSAEARARIGQTFHDTAKLTWGLQATKAGASAYTGKGVKVAILDTGLDMTHPDFDGRPVIGKSFIPNVPSFQDGHGHGTHCTGTACGALTPAAGRRYGVAHEASIYIGKVLSDQGSGADGGILAAIDWAIGNGCQVISMSLGADVPTTSVAYEEAGLRALAAGALIVAAAGNNANRPGNLGFVGRPANSRSFMAVGAVDRNMLMGFFSARDTRRQAGTDVDIAAPGVEVYSSWIMPARNKSIMGTSMAAPHVAGIAALWSEKTGVRGWPLRNLLTAKVHDLGLDARDVGKGLVQAP